MPSPTLADVAREASVAASTASIVLSKGGQFDKIPETTRKRIQAAARKLKYQPYAGARQLKRNRSGTIALLLSAETNRSSLSNELLFGISIELQKRDLGLNFVRLDDESLLGNTPRFLRQKEVDGVLVNYNVKMPRELLDLIEHYEIPAVFLNIRKVENAVWFDHYRATRQLIDRLVALRHRHIMLLNFTEAYDHYSVRDSMRGYRDAMRKAGLDPWVEETPVPRTGRRKACLELLAPGKANTRIPTAVFALSQSSAIPLVQAAGQLGIDIPGQLSVCTYGEPEFISLIDPQPGYITHPWREAAQVSVQMLLNRIEGKADKKLSGRLECGWNEGCGTIAPPPRKG